MWMRAEYRHRVNSHLSTIIRGSQRAVLKVEYRQSFFQTCFRIVFGGNDRQNYPERRVLKRVRIFAMKIILKNRGKYREPLSKRKGQNIGTLKKREQGSMLLSSNYRRNSTYVANIG